MDEESDDENGYPSLLVRVLVKLRIIEEPEEKAGSIIISGLKELLQL